MGADFLERESGFPAVAWNITRIIVPFYYPGDFSDTRLSSWEPRDLPLPRFFPHIQALLGPTGRPDAIGRRYVLGDAGRASCAIPPAGEAVCLAVADREICRARVTAVELYLFETKVGFLTYEIAYEPGAGIDAIIEGNYYFKRQSYENYCLSASGCPCGGTLTQMTAGMLAGLGASTADKQFRTYQSLVFSVAILDNAFAAEEQEQRLKEYLFRLRRAFKESYKPAAHEYTGEDNPEVFQSFQNSYWGISLEGLSNIAYLVDDADTNHFFGEIYPELVRTSYFFIYLLALHQRYALMQLNTEATDIDKSLPKETRERLLDDLTEKIGYFALRCYHSQISDNTHYARLYSRILQELAVEQLMKELNFELEVLSSLARLKDAQAKERQEKRENKFKNHLLLLTTLFVGVSTTADLWSIFLNLHEGKYPSDFLPLFTGLIGIIWSAIIAGIGCYYFRFREKKDDTAN